MIAFLRSSFYYREEPLPQERGQGLVEYALILVLVAIVVIAILAALGPTVGQVYEEIACALYGGSVEGTDTPDPYCLLPDGRIGNYFDLGVQGQEGV